MKGDSERALMEAQGDAAHAEALAQLEAFLEQAVGWRARCSMRQAIRYCRSIRKTNRTYSPEAKKRLARKKTEKDRLKNEASKATAANRSQRWTAAEDAAVLAPNKSDPLIAAEIGRTIKAVKARRQRLQKEVA